MKNLYSIVAKIRQSNSSKQLVAKSNESPIAFLSVAILTLLFTSACSPELSTGTNTDIESAIHQKKQQEIAHIEESIKNSYALIASERPDVCPKLVQKDVDDNTIKRSAEVMTDNHCDYFLYPQSGQHISVIINNDQIEALLIVPALHDFADGNYQVASYDKHVIRLAYNGTTYKPQRLTYDVEIIVTD